MVPFPRNPDLDSIVTFSQQQNNKRRVIDSKRNVMKAKDHAEFDPLYPEKFNWGFLDSPVLSRLGQYFAQRILDESQTASSKRNSTPGLREALNAIAQEALL